MSKVCVVLVLTIASLSPHLALAQGRGAAEPAPAIGGTGPTIAAPRPPLVEADVAPTLSPAAVAWLRARMRAYVADKLSDALGPSTLAAAGLSESNDFVQQARTIQGHATSGFNVAPATTVPIAQRPAVDAVDPAAEQYARSVLRQRLHREPTAAETRTELRDFDAQVARINAALATRRSEIATAMARDRQFPRAIDAQVLGLAAPDPAALSSAARIGLAQVFVRLIEASANMNALPVLPQPPHVLPGPVVPRPAIAPGPAPSR